MPISKDEVMQLASLARITLTDDQQVQFTNQLNSVLQKMDALRSVNTSNITNQAAVGLENMRLRPDIAVKQEGDRILNSTTASVSPSDSFRDGFILVPRLSTHEEL